MYQNSAAPNSLNFDTTAFNYGQTVASEKVTTAKPIHILALNWRCLRHPQAGGSEVNLFEQARRWARQGHSVTIIAADPGRDYAPEGDELIDDGLIVKRMGGRVTVYLHAAWHVLLNSAKYNVILDVANGIPFFSVLFSRVRVILLVHHVHGEQWFREFPSWFARLGWFLEHRLVPKVYRHQTVITVSPTTEDAMVEIGYNKNNIQIIYNGIEAPYELKPFEIESHSRIVYLGRIKSYKRLDLLVRAVAKLLPRFPDLHLDIAGDGDDRANIETLVHDLKLQDHVILHGFVDDFTKARLLHQATVFASPSMHEGWGISVIEANTYGCPAVAYNVPGLSASIRHQETGMLANNDDEFCSALETILADRALRMRLSKNALDWASKFSWDASAEQTLQTLRHGVI